MSSHFAHVGVTQGGVLDSEGGRQVKATRDFSNDRDWFSPAAAFNHTVDGVTYGKGAAFFMAPFWQVGGDDDAYPRIDRVGIFLYTTNMIFWWFWLLLWHVDHRVAPG